LGRGSAESCGAEAQKGKFVVARAALLAALILAGCNAGTPANAIDITMHIVGDATAGTPVDLQLSGPLGQPGEFVLPSVSGLTVNGTGGDPYSTPPSYNFFVTPAHAGDYTIPAFNIRDDKGVTYHVAAFTLHVSGG
jgi:hypothetical protein